MNNVIGTAGLAVALVSALATIFVSILAVRRDSPRLKDLSRQGVYVVFAASLVSAAALVNAFVTHDFTNKYVQRYSDVRQPVEYLVSAFWGGQPGSLLFWAVLLAGFSAAAAYFAKNRTPELMPWTHAVQMVLAAFFFILLLFVTSPFEVFRVIDPPTDGHGLNPLLQNYWMAIHPPCLLTGYASLAIPFSFGAAALLSGRLNLDWIKVTRRWLLVSWMFLSVGNILGGRWAYEELGWGGYWAWDPVENAAILPWFTSTALLHSVMVQEHRGMLKRWNFFLLFVTFWLTLFGTFLTRSGVLASVHTFAESGIGPWFLGSVIFVALAGALLLVWRWRLLAPQHGFDSPLSRESMFLVNNWIFLAFTFVVLWGTVFPAIKQQLTGQESGIGPPWFNRFAVPLALVLLIVMALGTTIAWRRATKRNVRRSLAGPLLATLVITPVACAGYYFLRLRDLQPQGSMLGSIYAIVATALVVLNLAIIVQEFTRAVRSRKRRLETGAGAALFSLISKHRRRYGGYLVHIGFVLILFGIAGNAFKISQRATLRQGEAVALGDYLVRFDGIEVEQHAEKVAFFANLSISQCDHVGAELDPATCGSERHIRPARFDYTDYTTRAAPDPEKMTSEVAIATNLWEDVYIAPSGMQPQAQIASFEMFVNPFTLWVWVGGIVLLGAVLICMWPERVPVAEVTRVRALRPAFDRLAMWLLALLPLGLLLGGSVVSAQEADGQPAAAQSEGGVVVVPVRSEGTVASQLYGLIRCACEGCGGATLNHCNPTCAEGRVDRERIDAWVAAGKTRDEILDLFVAERGEMALAIPRDTVTVWAIPILAVVVGGGLVWVAVRSFTRARAHRQSAPPRAALAAGGTTSTRGYEDRLALELSELD